MEEVKKANAEYRPVINESLKFVEGRPNPNVIILKNGSRIQFIGMKRKPEDQLCSSSRLQKLETTALPVVLSSLNIASEAKSRNFILCKKDSIPSFCAFPKPDPNHGAPVAPRVALPQIRFILKKRDNILQDVMPQTSTSDILNSFHQISSADAKEPSASLNTLLHRRRVLKLADGNFQELPLVLDETGASGAEKATALQKTESFAANVDDRREDGAKRDSSSGTTLGSSSATGRPQTMTKLTDKNAAKNPKILVSKKAKQSTSSSNCQYYSLHCPFNKYCNAYVESEADENRNIRYDNMEVVRGDLLTATGNEENMESRQPLLWNGYCPVCSSWCISLSSSTEELFDHLDFHKQWILYCDLRCPFCPRDFLPSCDSSELCSSDKWRAQRMSVLSEHLRSHHGMNSSIELSPQGQLYNLIIDPTKVLNKNPDAIRFTCPVKFSRHMMNHAHILTCKIICFLCFKKNSRFGGFHSNLMSDVATLREHYRKFHSTELEKITIAFYVRARPGTFSKLKRAAKKGTGKIQMSSKSTCLKPVMDVSSNFSKNKHEELADVISAVKDLGLKVVPKLRCPQYWKGCHYLTSNMASMTDHVDYHMAPIPLIWRICCHHCCASFDNFFDAMAHLSEKKCHNLILKLMSLEPTENADLNDSEVNLKEYLSNPVISEVNLGPSSCRSYPLGILAQKYVDIFNDPKLESFHNVPTNMPYTEVLLMAQMGLFLVVQPPSNSETFLDNWTVVKDVTPSNLARFPWLGVISQVRLENPDFVTSGTLCNISSVIVSKKVAQIFLSPSQLCSKEEKLRVKAKSLVKKKICSSPTVIGHTSVVEQLLDTKGILCTSFNNLHNSTNNLKLQPENDCIQTEVSTLAHTEPCATSRSLETDLSCYEVGFLNSDDQPIMDLSKNLNRSEYAELETLFVGHGYGVNETVKVIIKEINSSLLYQCPYCIYHSRNIFHVASHLVQQHDNTDLERGDEQSLQLKTHTLLMHCRLCDFVTYHHISLLWHFQNQHNILDAPADHETTDEVEDPSPIPKPEMNTTVFQCAMFGECRFASSDTAKVVKHSYRAHSRNKTGMFGIGHIKCIKTVYGPGDLFPLHSRRDPQFVCAHCHGFVASSKAFANHYLNEHSSCLLYICMYCESQLNSLAAIVKHIDYRHAGFERLICSVAFVGSQSIVKKPEVRQELEHPTSLVVMPVSTDSLQLVENISLPVAASTSLPPVQNTENVFNKVTSSGHQRSESSSSAIKHAIAFSRNHKPHPIVTPSSTFCDVKKLEGSDLCSLTFRNYEISLPYNLIQPLLEPFP